MGLWFWYSRRLYALGGTAAVAGEATWVPTNHHMAEVGVADSRSEALGYMTEVSRDTAEPDLLAALVDNGRDESRLRTLGNALGC